MCRNIKKLRFNDRKPTDQELHDAALQFVRKISGYQQPSKANLVAFEKAVTKIAGIGKTLFVELNVN